MWSGSLKLRGGRYKLCPPKSVDTSANEKSNILSTKKIDDKNNKTKDIKKKRRVVFVEGRHKHHIKLNLFNNFMRN